MNSSISPEAHNDASGDMLSFIESAIGDDNIRVAEDFGYGYVRLRSSEAQKRQAAQDIQSSEDILIELLRNSRDAGAKNIFVATSRSQDTRQLTIIDDGVGIPENMFDHIFEPRVTSKLDTAHMDKWGMHGRGMALYSISVNAEESFVVRSKVELGTSIKVVTNVSKLPEKTDQSTFPHFEFSNGVYSMRGPKNLIRTCAEFALEHSDGINVYFGSPLEVVSTAYEFGIASISPARRAFIASAEDEMLFKKLSFAGTPEDLTLMSNELGLEISERSARRVLDGQIKPLDTMADRIKELSFAKPHKQQKRPQKKAVDIDDNLRTLKTDEDDRMLISEALASSIEHLADKYYISKDVEPELKGARGKLIIEIPTIDV